ncbi:MAG: response regulator transcription factor [Verrucomicrobiales bacterium]|jgi:DNA-binding NarL/FixJ family response regulator|nr:response regulator transcription factor [Verrucomicrobiales bacterium]MDP4849617.1 response regulator transcription factor [Verrucomicrobiales bacterium]MDP5005608.1 response regulator transcription factor [Verrucomicrobiales bacterium]
MSKTTPTLSVMLVDDHLIVRRGLASLIGDEPDLSVVAEASSGEEAIALASVHRPDVIVLDLRLRDMSGIDVAEALRGHKILMLSSFMQEEDVRRVFDAGILGYLSKDKDSTELLKAIRAVGQGNRYLPPEISLLLAKSEHSSHLTARELEILKLIAEGRANKQIGEMLTLSENTVKNHVKSILAKLNAKDRTHAVTEALKRGLFQLGRGN